MSLHAYRTQRLCLLAVLPLALASLAGAAPAVSAQIQSTNAAGVESDLAEWPGDDDLTASNDEAVQSVEETVPAFIQVSIGPFARDIAGHGFEPGEPITVTIDVLDTTAAPDHSWVLQEDFPEGGADVFEDGGFNLHGPFNDEENPLVLGEGDIVTATQGDLTLSHTVRYVEFTEVDAQSDTVTGLASPGEVLGVSKGNPGQWQTEQRGVSLQACGGTGPACDDGIAVGTWTADFTSLGGILDGDSGAIEVPDEHGNYTVAMWGAPFVAAGINQDFDVYDSVWGAQWYLDDEVSVTVLDSERENLKFEHTYPVDKRHWNGFGSDDPRVNPTDVVVGDVVQAKGLQTGTVTEHQILDLVVEGWEDAEPDASPAAGNLLFGTAQPEGPFGFVRVDAGGVSGEGQRFGEIVNGAWQINFYDALIEGEWGDEIEIQFGVNGSVELRGPNGNLTFASWGTHEGGGEPQGPTIEVDPVDDVIYAYGYEDRETIGMTLDGVPLEQPEEREDPGDGDDRSVFIFDVYPDLDIRDGNVVATADGRTHEVQPLTVTDLDGSAIFGTASQSGTVIIDLYSDEEETGGYRVVNANADGDWWADFAQPPEEGSGDGIVTDVTGVRTSINVRAVDGDGDATVVSIGENLVGMFVVPELDLVMASDWSGLAPLSIEVGGETFPFDLERGPDMVSFGGFDFPDPISWYVLAELPIDLVPGQVITATDGLVSTSHVIRDVRVNEADTFGDTISGYGEPPQVVTFLMDDSAGAGVGFTELLAAGPWTVELIDASSELELPYDLQHFDGTGIALVPEEDDGVGPDNATAVLWDMAPNITKLVLPAEPVRIELGVANVELQAEFTDIEFPDTHTATVDWGDGHSTTEPIVAGQRPGSGGTIEAANHDYFQPGVYRVALTVADGGELIDIAEFLYVVVYDPSAGSAIGNGKWETDDGTLATAANFGFNVKYKQDSTTPDGNFKFSYESASDDSETKWKFKADTLDHLVISGEWAQFAGSGSLDHDGGTFDFRVTVVDGERLLDDGTDLIRVQIWDETGMLYDNQAGDSANAYPTAGIHKGEVKIT